MRASAPRAIGRGYKPWAFGGALAVALLVLVQMNWTHHHLYSFDASKHRSALTEPRGARGEVAAQPAGWASSEFHSIPTLIHQTWKTREVPSHLAAYVKSWTEMNPDYTHKLWTDEDVLKHMQEHHPQLAAAWPKMEPLERADTFRYAVLHDLGGYYADIDVACVRPINSWVGSRDTFFNVDFIAGFEVVTDDPADVRGWFLRPYVESHHPCGCVLVATTWPLHARCWHVSASERRLTAACDC
jgi:mannosyltransferase OCH1-like enzyme